MNYFPNDGDGLHLCSVCGDHECQWPATVCWRCREQEMIDAEPWLDDESEYDPSGEFDQDNLVGPGNQTPEFYEEMERYFQEAQDDLDEED